MPITCDDDAQCPGGMVCDANRDQCTRSVCPIHDDCRDDAVCIDGVCHAGPGTCQPSP